MRAALSVAIITLNEEHRLPACLESVVWADEVVVCDSGSTDHTVRIAQQHGARTFEDTWRGFSGHKNLAVERCQHPWVLVLDADERVTADLRREIEGVLVDPGALDGYLVPRRNYFLGQWIRGGGWYPDKSVRLFQKQRGRFAERAVHETVLVDGRVGSLLAPLEHFTYDSIGDFLARMGRYAILAGDELYAAGRRVRLRDVTLRPGWTFLRMYLLQRGFIDGWRGLLLAGLYACYTFAKYAHLWEQERCGTPRAA